jgi:glycosyltransferase involved in cell wall biosynthesis
MPPRTNWTDPAGVPVSILTRRSRGRLKDVLFALRSAWILLRRRRDYDLVYFLMQGLQLAAGLPIARRLGKPILMKFSGSGIIPLLESTPIGRLELRWLRQWAARIMILNPGMVEEARAHGLPEELLLWMPNPVDVALFRPGTREEIAALRHRSGIPESAPVVVYVGRLSPEKGLVPLLRGFARVARSLPEAVLVLVGDGPSRSELEALANDLGLGRRQIRFAGRVDVSEVPAWLRMADVFSLLSPNEGFSCALSEAMAAGLPAVVSDIPANAQLVEQGVHGLLVPCGDENATAAAFLDLLGNPQRRAAMSAAARQRIVDCYSTLQVVARYEELFASVLPRLTPSPQPVLQHQGKPDLPR